MRLIAQAESGGADRKTDFDQLGLQIDQQFNRYFSRWKIVFSPQEIANRKRGGIEQGGWVISY
jgi:hypothetical protein